MRIDLNEKIVDSSSFSELLVHAEKKNQIPAVKNQNQLAIQSKIPHPNSNLQDIVSHKVSQIEIQEVSKGIQQVEENKGMEDRGNNIHKVAKEAGLSPKALAKSGKKQKVQEVTQTKRTSKRTASSKDCRYLQKYKRRLGIEAAISNTNDKICVFVEATVQWEVLMDEDQQITLKIHHQDIEKDIIVSFVYAKCDEGERLALWDDMYQIASSMNLPWMIGEDFNVILSEEEKLGGTPVTLNECEDFAFCVNSYDLFDMGFKGSPYTWWNGRAAEDYIFKRLDIIMVNSQYREVFSQIEVEHLTRTGSDHSPMLLSCGEATINLKKPFRFLNFWTQHESFQEVVKQHWQTGFVVKVKEQLFEEDPSIINIVVLQKAQAELKKYLNIEEQYWKQKAGVTWFIEGDRNTNFFHNHVNGKRKKLHLNRIQNDNGVWLETVDQILKEAVKFFRYQFTQEGDTQDFEILQHVPAMHCWDIGGNDVHAVVLAFFDGKELPKSITHTNLVLIPKKQSVRTFSDMRPISLSNFINKVISRAIHDRLESIIPSLISSNQSGFVKGRSIFENILLTQEIVSDIRIRGKPANVVIKLDMAKTYDRVS
ncbi:uncharacterized protein LOC132639718 [Lycium barbarum]|uniref:uncharacterized protein LOC132639718 n=1 Tax=Lycium barbarum TaxID=112863 RepID=UPI00293EFF20|nr:uncharacterized protein LOC132639718 [Lycium barbarum]